MKQQAVESKEYRLKLYKKVGLKNKKKILDVGCGTGAVTRDIGRLTKGKVLGIDIDKKKLKHAEKLLKMDGWTSEKIEKYRDEQIMMIKSKMCFKFTPCFYAIGKKI